MENIKYGRRREGRWTPIRAKAQDTRANPNSSETHLVRKRWDIGLLRALNPRIMMMMMIQALLSKELILDNCKHFRVNSRFTKISKWPILPRCLGQDEHDYGFT